MFERIYTEAHTDLFRAVDKVVGDSTESSDVSLLTDDQVIELANAHYEVGRTCSHQHDCCGCWTTSGIKLLKNSRGERFIMALAGPNV